MKEEEASRTSDNSAAMRAIHLTRHGEPKIFSDPYAIRLTSRHWQVIIENRFLCWLFGRNFLYGWIHPLIGDLVARARYAEEQLESTIREGFSQYVLLGAGMDSFALRKPKWADSLTIFEIDHPATQKLKKKRIAEIGVPLPKNHFFLPVDFHQASLAEALSKSCFSAEVPAFFSWLGTVVYIEKSAVLKTLGDVASCTAKGSRIVFTYCDPEPFEGKGCSVLKSWRVYPRGRYRHVILGVELTVLRCWIISISFVPGSSKRSDLLWRCSKRLALGGTRRAVSRW